MRVVSNKISNEMERGFFGNIKSLYSSFSEDFFRITDQYLHLPTDDFGKRIISTGEDIIQATPLFDLFVADLDPAIMGTAEILDDINRESLLTTNYFWKLQEKTTRYRRWMIVTNRITRTIKKRIKYAVDGVLQVGGTVDDLERDIISVFKKYNKGEAYNTATIARTEMNYVIRNTEFGYMREFSKQKKVKMKKDWETREDERVRVLHGNYYNKQGWLDLEDYYRGLYRWKDSVIATKIKRPHDPKGKAFDVINCRCKLKYKAV